MASGVQVWSKTAATNASIDTNINFAEGQAPSSLNDSDRALMASVAAWRDDNSGVLVTSGTSIAYTVATNQVEAALTAGYTVTVNFNVTNGSSATLAVDGLAAAPLQLIAGTNVSSGAFQAGTIQRFTYSTTGTGQWIANNYIPTIIAPLFTSLSKTATTATTFAVAGTFVDALAITQGSSGTWMVMGTATFLTSGSSYNEFLARIWDGTTTFASGSCTPVAVSNQPSSVGLSAIVTNPAGNLRLSGANNTAAVGSMASSSVQGGCSILAVRIG
jgi:hypothetical protein